MGSKDWVGAPRRDLPNMRANAIARILVFGASLVSTSIRFYTGNKLWRDPPLGLPVLTSTLLEESSGRRSPERDLGVVATGPEHWGYRSIAGHDTGNDLDFDHTTSQQSPGLLSSGQERNKGGAVGLARNRKGGTPNPRVMGPGRIGSESADERATIEDPGRQCQASGPVRPVPGKP